MTDTSILSELFAEAAALRDALTRIQWGDVRWIDSQDFSKGVGEWCPWCQVEKNAGHATGCIVLAALAATHPPGPAGAAETAVRVVAIIQGDIREMDLGCLDTEAWGIQTALQLVKGEKVRVTIERLAAMPPPEPEPDK